MHMFSEDVLVHQNWSDKIILYFIVIWSQCFRGKVVALSICSIPNLTWKNTAWKYHANFLGNTVFVKCWYHEIFRLPAESILGIASWQSNWFILIMYMLKCICRANKLYFRISNLNTRILSERDFVISETLIFWTYLEICKHHNDFWLIRAKNLIYKTIRCRFLFWKPHLGWRYESDQKWSSSNYRKWQYTIYGSSVEPRNEPN